MPPPIDLFEPATYSTQELEFLLAHLGESAAVALADPTPRGVNPTVVSSALAHFTELDELQRERNRPWAGYDQVRDSIARWLAWQDRCLQIKRHGGPRHPSMFAYDGGDPRRGAIGTDSADMVRSEILDDGARRKFGVNLVRPAGAANLTEQGKALMPWLQDIDEPGAPVIDDVQVDKKKGLLTCSICDHIVKFSTDPAKGSQPYNLARAHMAKHLRTAKTQTARHQALRAKAFA